MRYFIPRRYSLLVLCLMVVLGGCATYARQIVLRYDPVIATRFGSGDLYLVNADPQPPAASGAWALGTTKNTEGMLLDTLWSGGSPSSLVQIALQRELDRTGYQVIPAKKTPDLFNKVVEITAATVNVDQVSNISRINATCTVNVAFTVMKNGMPVRRLRYEAKTSDLSIKDRERLAEILLNTTMQEVMKQAVPDIVAILEQQ